jgi:Protein of unknown function (DUF3352)
MANKGIAIAAVGLVAAAGAGYAGYKYIYSGESNAGDLASVIPANAYMVGYISNEPGAWEKLQKFGTPAAQKIITAQIKEAEQKFLTESKVNFNTDVQPWLGNTMFAILPNTDSKSTTPHILIAVGVKDKIKALAFADKMKAQSKEPSKEVEYKGIKITDSGKGTNKTFTALVNERLVISSEKRSIELAIDTAQGQTSVASKAGSDWFKGDSLGLRQPIAAFYVPNYAQGMEQMIKSSGSSTKIEPAILQELKKIQSIAGAVAIDDAGIRMKMVAKTDGTIPTMPNIAGNASASFPSDTFALVGGAGLSQIWTEVNKIYAQEPEAQKMLTQARQGFTQATQLDLDKDVFSWMGGDYTMGMMPVNSGIVAQAGFGGVLTIDSTNRTVTDNTVAKLIDMAKKNGATVAERQVGSAKISDVKAPGGVGTVFSYGWLSDKSLSIAVGDGLMEKIANRTGESIDKSSSFTSTMGSMPSQRQSYSYIDIEKIFNLVNTKMGAMATQSIPADVNAMISSMQGIGMVSTQPDKNTSQFEALLALKPATK